MELPLVLRRKGDSLLSYSIPLWYRLVMALVLGILAASAFLGGSSPGVIGWAFIVLASLACLYEERWTFDRGRGTLRHRFGLLVAARTIELPFAAITAFRLLPWARGTMPGSLDERSENERTLAESRGWQNPGEDGGRRRSVYKKPYIALVCESEESTLLVNMVGARRGSSLRSVASEIASFCDKPLEEGPT